MTAGPGKPVLPKNAEQIEQPLYESDTPAVELLVSGLPDRYSFEREVGRGGAAYVFLVRDLERDRLVAMKILRPELSAAVDQARFRREIEISSRLKHPNILPLFDFGTVERCIYFTMPYIAGGTLRTRLRAERQLSLSEALGIISDVGRALAYAHANSVIHRDVKPGNILLGEQGAIVADFGIARAISAEAADRLTASGIAIGTPEYMSPEQGTGRRDLDARSDVYSLGCVLYEMLAGEPPFTGATPQAVIARHCVEEPRSLRVIRAPVPIGVERAISKALAKVPADRFAGTALFVEALEKGLAAPHDPVAPGRFSLRVRVLAIAAVVAVIIASYMYFARWSAPPLDRNRIVVFPLYDPSAGGSPNSAGEAVATFIGYALDETRPLKWLDGWELLDTPRRRGEQRLTPSEARRVSVRAGAGFYIDGSIVRRPDSVTVILRLHSLLTDSLVRIEGRSGPASSASLPQLGLRAMSSLLPDLVAPGGRIDLSELSHRDPTAIANFLQGEREYRRMQFKNAVAHYKTAIARDSAFALAALRGAQAANWSSDVRTDVQLAGLALGRVQSLPPAQALIARGLHAYLTGAADSAVSYFQRALSADSSVHAGWTLLGEVYSRLLPSAGHGDSLARYALERARRVDPDFAPTLLLLEEMALRSGDVRQALVLRRELRLADADTTHAVSREIMLRCVRDGVESVDWHGAVLRTQPAVVWASKTLGGGASQPHCAIAAFRAVLQSKRDSTNARWGALLGMQAQLAATGRKAEARQLLASPQVTDLPIRQVYLLVGAADEGFQREAGAVADSTAASYDKRTTIALWQLGSWEYLRGNVSRVRQIAALMQQKADSSHSRRDKLLTKAIMARLRLLEGDSAGALMMLKSLAPSASRAEITWQPWESLGLERMLLAKLLYARGELEAAHKVAMQLESTEPIIYPLYLRSSLELRMRIARSMRNLQLADLYDRRLQRLSRSAP